MIIKAYYFNWEIINKILNLQEFESFFTSAKKSEFVEIFEMFFFRLSIQIRIFWKRSKDFFPFQSKENKIKFYNYGLLVWVVLNLSYKPSAAVTSTFMEKACAFVYRM